MNGALDGIRVLELGQLIAGPFCGQLLADNGAEVLKIEPPKTGDAMREWGRSDDNGKPIWWSVIARNKKSVTLNLRLAAGQDILKQLVADADVLIENFRPGTMERWGLSYEELSRINPRLIMVRISGFGQTGPYAERAGFASVCEAMGGLRHIAGYPDRPSVRSGISIGDSLAGVFGAMGALLALQARHVTGRGQIVDSSIYESSLAMTEAIVAEYDRGGHIRSRTGPSLPGIAPSNAYPCSNERDVIIGANQDTVYKRMCTAMDQPELATDPRFDSHRSRGANAEELDDIIGQWTQTHTAEEVVKILSDAGVPVGLEFTAVEMLADPHYQERESIIHVADAQGDKIAMQNVFPRLNDTTGQIRHTGPTLGEHTVETLTNLLGLSDQQVDLLRESGTI
ncbi:CaiB/BaiF CoA transferase family protein [Granulosicoccus antarcticus]|uniref:Succinyl-CoA--L-malate CoA-transferase beta subunit n=1 Tax=Granulosicoccus antarcticus IMCC3135 TaxID=1192854 RepID=A0A2Z2P0F5_9GAMM|nr:CoA transferase [Granulosicoccus antarcticus]ASJ72924.1 Succinyl-CoA--L-malate CoA-transferase beta subunit [Granulosicoccus antarcticus IMCC3135]